MRIEALLRTTPNLLAETKATSILKFSDDCIMKDKISGLTWSESYPLTGIAPASTTLSWQKAIQHCNNLSFGTVTGWRLPTQKELIEASIHGLRDVG